MQTTASLADILKLVEADYRANNRTSITSLPGKVKALLKAFPGLALEEFCYDVVDEVAKGWLAEGFFPATVNRRIAMLKRAFHLAHRHGIIRFPLPEFPFYTEDNARSGFLDVATAEKLWTYLPVELADFCKFLYVSGMRKGQAARLTWEMVVGDELHIPAKLCKCREPQVLPLTGALGRIVAHRREARTGEAGENIFRFRGLMIDDFRWHWKRAVKFIGKPHLLVHDLRRSAIRNLRLKGIPHEVCKQITGHKTDSVFWRYRIVTDDEVRKAFGD